MSIRRPEGHEYMPTDKDLREVIAPYADDIGRLHDELAQAEKQITDLKAKLKAAERSNAELRAAIHDARAVLEAPPFEELPLRTTAKMAEHICRKADEAKRIFAEVDDAALTTPPQQPSEQERSDTELLDWLDRKVVPRYGKIAETGAEYEMYRDWYIRSERGGYLRDAIRAALQREQEQP